MTRNITFDPVLSVRLSLRAIRIIVHIIYGLLLAMVLTVTGSFAPKRYLRLRSLWTRRWLSAAVRILGVHITLTGRQVTGTALFTANHVSWLDILAMAAVLDGDFIAKQEVRNWPLLGWLAMNGGTLFVQRGKTSHCKRVIEEATFRLKSGRNVILFPEGTTTDGRQVLPFKPVLLRSAVLAHVPVQPVALQYHTCNGRKQRVAFLGEADFISDLWKVMAMKKIHLHISFCSPLQSGAVHERSLAESACMEVTRRLGLQSEARRISAA